MEGTLESDDFGNEEKGNHHQAHDDREHEVAATKTLDVDAFRKSCHYFQSAGKRLLTLSNRIIACESNYLCNRMDNLWGPRTYKRRGTDLV